MLKIDGARIMEVTGEAPGPRVGLILHALFDEVLENPDQNSKEVLEHRAKVLAGENPEMLKKMGIAGKEKKEEKEKNEVGEIRKKYGVK
jgi:hypothetical protein